MSEERKESQSIIDVVPDEIPSIPVEVENKSLQPQPIPTQANIPVVDDKGQQIVEEVPSQIKTIEIPLTDEEIIAGSKGNTEDASTWLAKFIERLKKIAEHFGWRQKQNG